MNMAGSMWKKAVAALCAMTLLFSGTAVAQETVLDALVAGMAKDAVLTVKNGEADFDMYNKSVLPANYASMPASFDLREQGYVPSIRSQGNWGSCWGFAIIAASEISILAELGITSEEYADLTGAELDLSEKHLAWFANSHLPAVESYPEGAYPFPGLEDQAGEGRYNRKEAVEGPNSRYNLGGAMAYGASLFAGSAGPVMEADYPYVAADGSSSTAADWSLGEEHRFAVALELENSSILPSPAMKDENGQYMYNPYGTFAIKQELINGRAVSIGYHSDQSMDPKAIYNMMRDEVLQLGLTFEEEDMECFFLSRRQQITKEEMTPGAWALMLKLMLVELGKMPAEAEEMVNGMTEEEVHELSMQIVTEARNAQQAQQEAAAAAEAEAAAKAEAADVAADDARKREKAKELGVDYDELLADLEKMNAANEVQYINTDTYAQYTNTVLAQPNHAVTIVGWDDNYAASNFLEGQQPPADGAWIVRNSWGSNYGMNGYFYLSYFDQTLVGPESFDFVTKYNAGMPRQGSLGAMDYMPTNAYLAARVDHNVSYANVFTPFSGERVLRYISVLTADLNAEVTADVYLLNADAALPTDGVLLDRVVSHQPYGGYHRIQLNHDFIIPEGARIGVVVTQRVMNGQAAACSIPYALHANEKYLDTYNAFAPEDMTLDTYGEGRVNRGESWVYADGQWHDWVDVLEMLQAESNAATYMTYDNLGIKIYSYMLDELQSMHNFDQSVPFNGVTMHQCSDCSYALIEQP